VYGEDGKPDGRPMYDHRNYMNGLSVDFMVPVRDAEGKSAPLPTPIWTTYGYDLEFDTHGSQGDLQIDFEAMEKEMSEAVD